jgi:PKD repeat protein
MRCTRYAKTVLLCTLLAPFIPLRGRADTHYVDINCATPASPYTNWTTAATVIQNGIDAASAGDTVLVADGVYTNGGRAVYGAMTNRIVIIQAMTVKSVNGPASTFIVGNGSNGSVRCAYVPSGALLAGFTLTNGTTRTTGDESFERSGGGVWCQVGGSVSNCIMVGNSASYSGGGSYGGGLVDCTLSGNAAYNGGGVAGAALTRCTLSGNFASQYGGGASGGVATNCIFSGNSAFYGGGTSYGALNNCSLSGNFAVNAGGGTYYGTLNKCVLSGNSAPYGGGTYYGTLNNCTVARNSASQYGGGAYGGTLNNSIVYYNTAPGGPNSYSGTLRYCCTTPDPGGTGNITSDPKMVSATHIAPDSPCVGKGSSTYAPASDVDGETWRTPPSIGTDEPYAESATGGLSVVIGAVNTVFTVGFEASFEALIDGRPTRSAWDFGDGSGLTNRPFTSHTWSSAGSYAVVLTAWNADYPSGVSCTTVVSVVDEQVYYVNVANTTPAYPHRSWETAATTIQDALSAEGLPGRRLVLVMDGVYEVGGTAVSGAMTNRVTLTNAVTVLSVNGPTVTIIKGNGPIGDSAVRCAYVATNCVLSGFTLTNGATRAGGSGGGVWCEIGGVVSNCTLSGNLASSSGGGAYYGILNNCLLIGNSVSGQYGYGGGAYCSTLNTCTLSGNSASGQWGSGGGAYGATLSNCNLTRNSAGAYGGGTSDSTLYSCRLSGNTAFYSGGGASGGTLSNCTLSCNSSPSGGGGVSQGMLINCTLSGNSAGSSGGGATYSTLNNCTLSGNTAVSSGGGILGGTLNNCIIYHNTAPTSPNWSSGTLNYCCTTPLAGGTGNITNDPILVSTSHIATNSPCVAKGSSAYTSGLDVDGEVWRTPPSIGADEPYAGSATGGLSVAIGAVFTTITVGFDAAFTALIDGRVTRSAWDFGDGYGLTNRPYASHAWAAAGTYPVVLTAWNADHVSGVSCTTLVSVVDEQVYYVNVSNTAPTHPYTSWVTAATNIQDAIFAQGPPGRRLVLVTNGMYEVGGTIVYGSMTNRIVLTNGVTVRSVGGPAVTVIKGKGAIGADAIRCAYVGTNCLLSGFTLTNGMTRTSGDHDKERSGGGVWCETGGIVSNCWLSGNSASSYGGGAYNGALINCTLSGNTANSGGGASYSLLINCSLSGNSASSGGGTCYGTLNNCTVSGNSASQDGGGAYGGTLNNSIVYYNTAPTGPNWSSCTLRYSCTTPDPGGTGNITADPKMVSATHIAADSPCVGKGSSTYAPASDVDGETWRTPPSIGMDEPYAESATGGLSVVIGAVHTAFTVGFEASFAALIEGRVTRSAWDFGDGIAVTNRPFTSHTWSSAGTYAVVLTAWNADYPSGVSCTTMVSVVDEPVYYVNVSNTTPAQPYMSWETAATNIQDAISVEGLPGKRLVLVMDGVYEVGGTAVYGTMPNRIVLTNTVTVRSVNGSAVTTIKGKGPVGADAVRCAYVGTNCLLAGFTLTNGATRTAGDGVKEQSGGGVWCEPGGVVSNCVLSGNRANNFGGGAYYGKLIDCTLTGNSATNGGGYAYGTLVKSVVSGNMSQKGGGTYYGMIENGVIEKNNALYGGGCYASVVIRSTVSSNSALYYGGGMNQGTLSNCTVSGNHARAGGGGASGGTLRNCTITGNSSFSSGGGASGSILVNCALTDNSAFETGGGTYNSTLNNCTVSGNTASSGGGAASGTLKNCIVYYNRAGSNPNYAEYTQLESSCTIPAAGGANITNAPNLVSSTHIAADSPCVGKGIAAYASGVDIDENAWRTPPSIGADEPYAVLATGGLAVAISADLTKLKAGFEAPFEALIEGLATRSSWDFGDGSAVTNQPYVKHAWSEAGTYEVVLTAWNADHPAGVSCTTVVSVVENPVYYVDIANVNPSYPYTSWDTAATNIQDAISAEAVGGRLVLVRDGLYEVGGAVVYGSLTNRVALVGAVTVRSVNGPATTIIKGIGPVGVNAVRCAYVGSDCSLAGFTLTNGATRTGGFTETSGGGVWCEAGGSVSNCWIMGNVAFQYGGGAYRGKLTDCRLSGNSADGGGGAYDGRLYKCTLSGNSSEYGGGSQAGELINCALTGNSATRDGGGALGGILKNCTLTGNYAGQDGGGTSFGTLNNCTLTDNEAFNNGGGVANSAVVYNSIVYHNRAPNGDNYQIGWLINYSCTVPDPGGTGNMTDDPKLLSLTHIAADSPCVGKGSSAYVSGVDIDGELWCTPPSIGADEPLAASATGTLSVAIGVAHISVSAGYSIEFTALIEGRVTRTEWNFGDGTTMTNRVYASHSWAAKGTYDVTLTAWNLDHPSGISCKVQVEVTDLVYHANVSNMTPVYPYTSWATAATNIQDAISASTTAGRLVLVSNGVYSTGGVVVHGALTNRISLFNAVTVRSVNGPSVTTIKGQGPAGYRGVRCAYLGENCVLAGFTLTNGASGYSTANEDYYTVSSGGGVWGSSGSVVSNCWLLGNSSDGCGGGAMYTTLNDCKISGNYGFFGGGAYGGTLAGCDVSSNTASYGGGVALGTLKNCSLVGNNAYLSGGGAYDARLSSCTVSGNTATRNLESSGGGVSHSVLENCVVYFNTATSNPNYSESSLKYSCTTPLATGIGNITNPPVFRESAGGNYRLDFSSPCINAGLNEAWMYDASDLDGKARILSGTVDMGAYEFAYAADLKVFLQGPYGTNTHLMVAAVGTNLPLRSPYAADASSLTFLPSNMVDWVLVEVQDTNRIAVASMSVFLDEQGRVCDVAGGTNIPVEVSEGSYYLVLRHRNHLAAMSALPVAFTNTVVSYDFTTGPDKYFGGTNACVELEPDVWGLIGGDADGDGRITPVDREIVERQRGKTGYLQGDLNLDGKVDGDD